MALLVDIEKKTGDFKLSVKFEIEKEVMGLLGASGCGKSMTLKCIAGIEKPDKGRIVLDDKVLFDSDKKINVPTRKRKIGYLFQDYALFPNMTVKGNIMCAMSEKNMAEYEEIITRFYIKELQNLYPYQLSGGQKQRVAMARLLAAKPDVVLLDEPFSALDSFLKWQIEKELLKVFESYDKTFIYVSHDRNEIYRMTDKMAVMENGSIVEQGYKKELFSHPKTLATTLLTGCKNFTDLEKIDDLTYRAVQWGTILKIPYKSEEKFKFAGYRAHFFTPVPCMEEANVIECSVENVIEDTFSVILVLRSVDVTNEGDWSSIRYELSKEEYARLKAPSKLFLKINPDKLIMLVR